MGKWTSLRRRRRGGEDGLATAGAPPLKPNGGGPGSGLGGAAVAIEIEEKP